MHICYLASEYPHPKINYSGGIGTSIKNLSFALIKQGITVTVIVYGQDKDESFKDEEVTIIKLKNIKLKGFSWFLTRKKIEKKINHLVDNQSLNLVEAPDWTGITSFVRPNCPVIIKLHGSDTYFCNLDNRKVKFWNKYHEKRALKNANGIISVSRFTAKKTNQIFNLNKEIEVIPNTVNTDSFSICKEHRLTNEKTILYFGTLIRKKGVLDITFIFKNVVRGFENVKLVLVGGDSFDIKTGNPSTWSLMRDSFSSDILTKVSYLGKVPYEKMNTIIEESDVCIFPSYAEALPVSWIEAMAMKKAIVASDIGWAPEVIEDGVSGYLVHPTNHQLYADKIIELLKNSEKSKLMGEQARKRVSEKFSFEVVANQNIEFYNKILQR